MPPTTSPFSWASDFLLSVERLSNTKRLATLSSGHHSWSHGLYRFLQTEYSISPYLGGMGL